MPVEVVAPVGRSWAAASSRAMIRGRSRDRLAFGLDGLEKVGLRRGRESARRGGDPDIEDTGFSGEAAHFDGHVLAAQLALAVQPADGAGNVVMVDADIG